MNITFRNKTLKIFSISSFPSVVGTYLKVSNYVLEEENELASALGAFLLSIYNLLCDADSFGNHSLYAADGIEIPNITNSSVYHDASVVSCALLFYIFLFDFQRC